jgi:hypothetical protein
MPVHNGLRPDDGECVAGVWKEPTDPPQDQLLCGNEWRSDRLGPAQQDDLLPKHKDFCLQRCSRSKQIGEETNVSLMTVSIRHSFARSSARRCLI